MLAVLIIYENNCQMSGVLMINWPRQVQIYNDMAKFTWSANHREGSCNQGETTKLMFLVCLSLPDQLITGKGETIKSMFHVYLTWSTNHREGSCNQGETTKLMFLVCLSLPDQLITGKGETIKSTFHVYLTWSANHREGSCNQGIDHEINIPCLPYLIS